MTIELLCEFRAEDRSGEAYCANTGKDRRGGHKTHCSRNIHSDVAYMPIADRVRWERGEAARQRKAEEGTTDLEGYVRGHMGETTSKVVRLDFVSISPPRKARVQVY